MKEGFGIKKRPFVTACLSFLMLALNITTATRSFMMGHYMIFGMATAAAIYWLVEVVVLAWSVGNYYFNE